MSVKVSSWVWHGEETAELAGNEMILLLALADVADDNGRCRFLTDDDDMTYSGLARKARIDRSTAIRVISRLRDRGLVEQQKGSRSKPNEFAIVVPWRKGGDLPPVRKVASEQRKVASEAPKGGNGDTPSSLIRIDVEDVVSAVPTSLGEKYSEPLCRILIGLMTENGVKIPERIPKPWLDAARLMIDRDGREPNEARAVLEWACRDSFWRANILSMPKFREKYDQLRLQSANSRKLSTVEAGRAAAEILKARDGAGRLAVSA